ncbi:hypothetical protein OHB49_42100 [Streptomyces sp. NBC_01717]|nr:hypothetical protein [Streptomyces sp. NBC_01717]
MSAPLRTSGSSAISVWWSVRISIPVVLVGGAVDGDGYPSQSGGFGG